MKKNFLLLFIAFTLIFTASCGQTAQKKEMQDGRISAIYDVGEVQRIRITSPNIRIRSGFSTNSPYVGTLKVNQRVRVVDSQKDSYVVVLPNNSVGVVYKKDGTPVVDQYTIRYQAEEELPTIYPRRPREPKQDPQANNYNLTTPEKDMITLINREREKNDLKPLKLDMELTKVARIKSQDMIDNDYFSHYSPTYGSPFEMVKKFGIGYLHAGENIAENTTAERAFRSLMRSEGHKKNILNPNFTHMGVGVKDGARNQDMFTQLFISKPQ